jgi:hypothetical protein
VSAGEIDRKDNRIAAHQDITDMKLWIIRADVIADVDPRMVNRTQRQRIACSAGPHLDLVLEMYAEALTEAMDTAYN